MTTLYEMTAEYTEILSMIESGDITAEDAADQLDSMGQEFSKKAESIGYVVRDLEAKQDALTEEIERLLSRKKKAEAEAQWLKKYLLSAMLKRDIKKLETVPFTFTYKAPTKVAIVDDETKLPESVFVEVPATRKLDKKALLEALKAGDVDGAHLGESTINLQIK